MLEVYPPVIRMGVCPFYFLVFTSFKEPDLPYDSDSKKYEIVKELAGDLS
jgi:hypothetical protein